MNWLVSYRRKLLAAVKRDLRSILAGPDETAVHDFRVGVKKLTALYYLLEDIKPELNGKQILQPYRSLSRSIGPVRDGQVALALLQDLDELAPQDAAALVKALRAGIRKNYRLFQKRAPGQILPRLPTIRATGLSESTLLREKPLVLERQLGRILDTPTRMNAARWHKKRILLKRYHHQLDVFRDCPGQRSGEEEMKQLKILEQLLGDWHDRVVTVEILQTFNRLERARAAAIRALQQQDRQLLPSARMYLNRFVKWHQNVET